MMLQQKMKTLTVWMLHRIKPEEGTSRIKRLFLKIAANGMRLDCYLRGQGQPKILCQKIEHAH